MIEKDQKTEAYFNSLPAIVQESIMQSGLEFDNEEDMRAFVSQIKLSDE